MATASHDREEVKIHAPTESNIADFGTKVLRATEYGS